MTIEMDELVRLFSYPGIPAIFVAVIGVGVVVGLGFALSRFSFRDMLLVMLATGIYTIGLETAHLHIRLALGHPPENSTAPLVGLFGYTFFSLAAFLSWKICENRFFTHDLEITDQEVRRIIEEYSKENDGKS